MLKEADFAYRQAFAFCPYSAEVVYHYIQILINTGRLDDAILVVKTCHELDPNYGQMRDLYNQLLYMKKRPAPQAAAPAQNQAALDQLRKQFQDNPSDFQHGFELAQAYLRAQQMPEAIALLDQMLTNTNADARIVASITDAFAKLNNFAHLEPALERMVQIQPEVPENWYNLAGLQAMMGKNEPALKNLRRALEDSAKRLATNPKATDLRAKAAADPQLAILRQLPEFQQLVAPPK